jgi:molybdate transport repressor ModE-like protein
VHLTTGIEVALPAASWGWLVALALLGQAAGWLLVSSAMRVLAPNTSATLLLLQPVAALGLALAILRETPTASQLAGCAVVIAAVAFANTRARETPEDRKADPPGAPDPGRGVHALRPCASDRSVAGMPLSPRVPELHALDMLLSVAQLGSLGAAAREHGISQPAASSRIRYMERLLGVALLERIPSGARLTAAGALVADWARPVVASAQAMDAGMEALRAERAGRLAVAASMTAAEYLLPGWIAGLHERDPELAVSLRLANSTDVAEDVLGGRTDLGFVEGPTVPDGLASRVVARDRLEVVVAPGHPWGSRTGAVPAGELAATALIQREQGSGTRYTLERVLTAYRPLAAPLMEASSTTAVRSAAATGLAPAVLSSLAVAADLAAGRLVAVEVRDIDMRRTIRAVWQAGRPLVAPARDLLAVASSAGAGRSDRARGGHPRAEP